MKVSDLTESERKVWQSAATGAVVDLRVGNPELDSPEKWAKWGTERTVRAEVVADLLLGDGEAAPVAVRGVRLQGARITGDLNLEAVTLRCPLALLDCSFASALNLEEATAVSVRLSGSLVPAIRARQLRTSGDLRLDKGFCVSGGVDLDGAQIGGDLSCAGGQFSKAGGSALSADGLTVEGDMNCGEGFVASGEVNLLGARIGGQLDCTGGQFSDPDGYALNADGLTVDGGMFCGEGFVASGEVNLLGAHIGGVLSCTGGQFYNSDGPALNADGFTVDGGMFCRNGFSASGEVRLPGAHITGQFVCTGGQFSNPDGRALTATGLTVDRDMICREGFVASGEVRLLGAHIGGQLDCTAGQFSSPNGSALNLERATVSGPLYMESTVLEGILDLTAAKTSSYHDDRASGLQNLRLDGFVYDAIGDTSAKQGKKRDSVKERLEWLGRNEKGYSPQIYDQLAAVYRRAGHEDDARRVLITKQRRRFAQRNPAWRGGGYVLDGLVGYGYRTWLAGLWLIFFLGLGTVIFNYAYYLGDLTPATKPALPPPFQLFLYTLDLLLPVISLHIRDAWIAHSITQVWSVVFIIVDWILATAVVLSLTGLLKRD